MLDKQFKLEGKIQNGSMFWNFDGQLGLENQGHDIQFSKFYETFRCSKNSSCLKIKF